MGRLRSCSIFDVCGFCVTVAQRVLLLAVILLPAAVANAQNKWWGLSNRAYYDSVMAEIHGAHTQVLFPMRSDAFQYAITPGRHSGWNIDLGHEFPVVGFQSNPEVHPNGVPAGAFGIGLWFPLSFHMIEDLGGDPSNPILDTDYRFSGMVKAQYGLRPFGPFRDSHLGLRFQFGHESTHVGDEFTINATRLFGDGFLRVNVSYEYWELGGSFEPNWGDGLRHHLKLRAGNIALFDSKKGWYNPEVEHPFGTIIAGSHRNIEPYADFEYYHEAEADCEKWVKCLGPIVSIDIRNRTIYNYAKLSQSQPEDTQVSTNLLAGLRQMRHESGLLGKIIPTYYLRYYHGVNPAGQFRNQSNYTLFGFGVNLDF